MTSSLDVITPGSTIRVDSEVQKPYRKRLINQSRFFRKAVRVHLHVYFPLLTPSPGGICPGYVAAKTPAV